MSKSIPQAQPDPDAGSGVQRWTAKRKAAVVLELLKGKITAAEAARQHDLTVGEVERWREDFITQGTEGLRSHPRDLAEQHEAEKQNVNLLMTATPPCNVWSCASPVAGTVESQTAGQQKLNRGVGVIRKS